MVVGADIFVAGESDQHRSRHQLMGAAAAMAAKAALAHIGDRVGRKLFGERLVVRSRSAAELGHRNVVTIEQRPADHPRNVSMIPKSGSRSSDKIILKRTGVMRPRLSRSKI